MQFGRAIIFRLQAEPEREVERVWLVYRLQGERARNRASAEFSWGDVLEAEWAWELESGMMAPGSTIYYRWELEDAAGERLSSPEGSFQYSDSRFRWEAINEGDLAVYFYQDRSLAERVLRAGMEAVERIADGTGMTPARPVRIYIYASRRDMAAAIPSRSEAFDTRTVTLGMSMGADALVLLGTDSGLLQTTAHELSHAIIHQRTDSPFARLPRWLDEGLAMYAEGELPRDNARALERAIREGNLLSLRSMTSYPGDARLVDLFYGQAYSIVAYMIEQHDAAKMKELLALLAEGVPVNEALQEAYGYGLADLEAGWMEHLGLQRQPAASTSGTIGRLPGTLLELLAGVASPPAA
ncbi:MAG: hypothetical protein HPY83_04660 [Anaerolineae bacterium]|nr:hypothetical protein [Anaerolineae bacterium]